MKVSKSAYYNWLKSGPSKRWLENEEILQKVIAIYENSHQSYGSPRIAAELRENDIRVSRHRIARIMSNAGIYARPKRKFKVTTDSNHNYPIALNLLNQNFEVSRPGEVWVSDITYVPTNNGWMYLTVVIDLFDRKVIGWAMSIGLSTEETILPAWKMAIKNRPITENLIFHSDRGVQYACEDFVKILNANPLIKRSMSRKGNCWDNAVAESFFKSLKVEMVYKTAFQNQDDAGLAIFEWIETWYNKKRRHSALKFKSIEEFELLNKNDEIAA